MASVLILDCEKISLMLRFYVEIFVIQVKLCEDLLVLFITQVVLVMAMF